MNIPLFALRSEKSLGIGEYLDLLPVLEWCKEVGFNMVQLLPLNDTGFESSPYSALSANALHPSYLSLEGFEECKEIEELRRLNKEKMIDYRRVRALKITVLRRAFERVEFDPPWFQEYGHYMTLKEANSWKSWLEWGNFDIDEVEVAFHAFVQKICFEQFAKVKKRAKQLGIKILGDIPILINVDSCDVWAHESLFDCSVAAGAPPDLYNEEGQYWGFPLYNWESHRKENFKWWKQRLSCAEPLYDFYRIDHIVGFFRIWAIPPGKSALCGHYKPKYPLEWLDQGREIIKMLKKSSSMIPIGEDLGMVPDEVKDVLTENGIAGTKVLRWVKKWVGKYILMPTVEYPKLSLTTLSTHDSETLAQWKQTDESHFDYLLQSHSSASLYHVNLLGDYLALFDELVWENLEDERINVPGTENARNWSIRMRSPIEEWTRHKGLKEALKKLT